jgi:hypothetical protein
MNQLGPVLLCGCLLALPTAALGHRTLVLPADEAVHDPEFFVFRAGLQAAVARRDTAEILRVIAPDMLNSFGGNGGREEFRRTWGLSRPDRSSLWATLGFTLALGGHFQGDSAFYSPYLFPGTPGDGLETLAVLGRDVPVRADPTATSGAIDTVSFEVVTRWREGPGQRASAPGWEPVRTSTGHTGWVRSQYLRSPTDYRAGFVRRDGRWWLRALVAGD